jgi:hypothetical protein
MNLYIPEEKITAICETQRIIALKYLEHFRIEITGHESLESLIGFRNGSQYYSDSGIREEYYPYDHTGKSVAIEFDLFEKVTIELINDINSYVFYIRCICSGDLKSEFLHEFSKNDKDFRNIISEEILSKLEDEDVDPEDFENDSIKAIE